MENPQPPKPPPLFKNLMFFAFVVGSLLVANSLLEQHSAPAEIPFSEFIAYAGEGGVAEVTIQGQQIKGVFKKTGESFTTVGPISDLNLRDQLEKQGVLVNYDRIDSGNFWSALLLEILPALFLLGFLIFFLRQLQGGGKAMNFGKSRARMMKDIHPRVTFDDIAGIDEAKNELGEIIDFLKNPEKFTKLGGRIPRGVLLIGSPGTGKTILAKGVAGEAGVPFFSISGSDFVEMFVGVGASRVRDLFERAKKHSPCIVFIDEIDAVGRQRGAGLGGGHDEREQTLNQLLVEMDGFEDNEGVIVIAASNRADVLDPALLRPGRFDRRVIIPKPDVKGRLGILKVHSKKTPLAKGTDFGKIAQGTPGFSGADLENLVNEAALIAARENQNKITMNHFELAKDKILMGPERKSMIMSDREKRITSYHEAGHALVGLHLEHGDPVHKVTIIPRGQALGVTMTLPEEDKLTLTKEYAQGMIAYAMGGRAAEELIFDHRTTGASDDINKATEIARKMVCQWGMSDKIGPISLNDRHGQDVFLGRDFSQSQHVSPKMHAVIDDEVHSFVSTGYDRALNILTTHREVLENMAEALLIKETLYSADLQEILAGREVVTAEERQAYEERILTGANKGGGVAAEDLTGSDQKKQSADKDSSSPGTTSSETAAKKTKKKQKEAGDLPANSSLPGTASREEASISPHNEKPV
ncbi:MAG: ATP-dependent zinc metalloprotease FtsH [Proteobacteria bacterium]|nr:ATP-dependent zinc metalloprotease FtsH [Pseudomonadota bacterium]